MACQNAASKSRPAGGLRNEWISLRVNHWPAPAWYSDPPRATTTYQCLRSHTSSASSPASSIQMRSSAAGTG